jgi:hypothetical protein
VFLCCFLSLFCVLFPMLPVPLALPFLNAPSVFSYVYEYHIHYKNNDNRNIPSASLELSIAASSKLSVDAISLWSTPPPSKKQSDYNKFVVR